MASKVSAEARAAFDEYVSSEAARVDEFRRIVASRGGPSESVLDLTSDSLGPLGAWLLKPVPPGPEDGWRPVWAFDRPADDPYLVGSWLPDGLGTYLMAMLRQRHPHLIWKLEDDRRSIYHGLPLIVGLGPIEHLPYTAALGNLDRARKGPLPRDPSWLVKTFDTWSDLAAKTAGTDLPDADADLDREIDDVSVEAIEGDRDWNAELWISEVAETVLGREAYDGLYDRFAAIPGVEQLEWEDRERFLLRLRRGADLELVRLAARRVMRDALAAAD